MADATNPFDQFDAPSAAPAPAAGANPFDQFDPNAPKQRGALGEIITAAKRGVYQGAQATGAVLQAPAEMAGDEPGVISKIGQSIEKWGKAGATAPENAPQPDTHSGVTNFLGEAAGAIPSAAPMIAAGAAGSLAGSLAGPAGSIAGGAAGAGGEAALQAFHEKYQQALEAGMSKDDARRAATANAALQGTLMAGVGAIPFAGGIAGKVLGTGAKDAADAASEVVAKKFWPEAAKAAAETGAVNVGLGAAGAAGEAALDQGTPLDKGVTPGQAAVDSLLPNVAGAAGFIPLALLGAHGIAARSAAVRTALTDPTVDPKARMEAATQVAQHVAGTDTDAAHVFAENAIKAIQQGKPIGVTSDWFESPHESVNQKALPAPGTIAPDLGTSAEDASVITANNEAETQRIADETYAARDAEEQRLAALRAQGPISSAAADAISSGAAADALDRRAAAAQPPALPEPIDAKTQRENDDLNKAAGIMGSVPLERAQQAAQVGEMAGYDYSVVPHPGGGFTVVPSSVLSDAQREQFANIQRAGQLPSPTARRPNSFIADSQGNVRPETLADNQPGMRQAFDDFRKVMGTNVPKQFPMEQAAAQAKADHLTATTGIEHEIVPHPVARDKFAVQPTDTGAGNAVQEQGAAGLGAHPGGDEGAGRPGEGGGVGRGQQGQEAAGEGQAAGQGAGAGAGLHEGLSQDAARVRAAVDAAAHEAATSPTNDRSHPTSAQAEAGNYKKGHIDPSLMHGLDVTIENPQGSVRVDTEGKWATTVPYHYGYIRGTVGADGAHVDATIGPKPESTKAFVVDQNDPKTGKFDEHKVMLGFDNAKDAEQAYRAAYPKDWKGFGAITETSMDDLKGWLKEGQATEPFAQRKQDANRANLHPDEVVEHAISPSTTPADHTANPDLARIIHEPTFLAQRSVNNLRAKGLTDKEAGVVAAAVAKLRRAGHPLERLQDIDHLFTQDTGSEATYYWQAKAVGLDRTMLENASKDGMWAQKLAGVLAHELSHRADEGENNFHSAEHPAFAFSARDAKTGLREARGGIAKEAFAAFVNRPDLRRYLQYPLRAMHDAPEKGKTERQHMEMLATEIFAQLNALYYTNPKLLQRTMPKAFALFKEIHEQTANQSRAEGHRAESPVQRTLRALGADGRPEERGSRQDQRADRAGTGDWQAGGRVGLDARVGERPVEEPAAGRVQPRGAESAQGQEQPPLEGLPKSSPGPFQTARDVAAQYMKDAGLPYHPPTRFVRVDPEQGKRVAEAYDKMPHDPHNPEVKRAYAALAKETIAQWHAMMKTGLKVDFTSADRPDYYKLPHDVYDDVRNNNHMTVFSTDQGFGSNPKFDPSENPLLAPTDIVVNGKRLLVNDVFRAVHDYFGHIKEGVGFRHDGEENAWRIHSSMFSPEAQRALTVETRGQNSWVNWGPHGETNRKASQEDTHYAEQKTGLLPREFSEDRYEQRKPEAMERRDTEPTAGETTVNIGLDTNDGKGITREEALRALKRAGVKVKVDEVRKSRTEQTLIASLDRPLTPEEAHKVAVELRQEAIAQKVGDAGELYGPQAEGWRPFNDKFFLGFSKAGEDKLISKQTDRILTDAAGTALTKAERDVLKRGVPRIAMKRAQRFAALFDLLPATKEYVHAALAGKAARGWYEKSRKAGEAMYGKDYPRFAALMAALSPQTDVPTNFYNAAMVWADWNRRGRPTDAKAIVDILNRNMITPDGKKAGAEVMDAYRFNAIRALRHATGDVQLSGPKVESFRQNLIGNLNEVTNDRHNAAFSGIMQELLGGDAVNPPETDLGKTFGIKSPGYIVPSIRYREAARQLSKLTGDKWSPAEVQETSWSFWRTLYNLATAEGETRSALQLIRDGALTHELIAETPTLGQYFDTQRYQHITRGEAQAADGNADLAKRISAAERGATREAGPIAETPAIRRIARRLDQLIADRRAAAEANAADKRFDETNKELNRVGAENAPEYEHLGDAAEEEPREIRKPMAMEHRSEEPAKDEPLWYSPLRKGIDEKAPFSKSGEIDARMLSNWLDARAKDGTVKPAEIEASGIKDWLALAADAPDAKYRKVSRADVQSFLDQNGVRVEEKMLGSSGWTREDKDRLNWLDEHEKDLTGAQQDEREELQARANQHFGGQTQYERLQLPGGKNYRELLLTLPDSAARARSTEGWTTKEYRGGASYNDTHDYEVFDQNGRSVGKFPGFATPADAIAHAEQYDRSAPERRQGRDFRSRHFDEPNILAHVRFNERTDAEGKKVLFIEELQSDWAQKGRREGFAGDIKSLPDSYHVVDLGDKAGFGVYSPDKTRIISHGMTRDEAVSKALKQLNDEGVNRSSVPNGPFVGKTEAWTALALKRMIRYAADNGFDRIAWTNGDQQAERYDLSKQADAVYAAHHKDGTFSIGVLANGTQRDLAVRIPASSVEEHVGKDLAKKVLGQPANDRSVPYKDADLMVGGEGMKAFYDKIVPNVANDVLKKLGGGRVGEVNIAQDSGDGKSGRYVVAQRGRSWRVMDTDTRGGEYVGGLYRDAREAIAAADELNGGRAGAQPGFDVPASGRKPMAMFAHVGDEEPRVGEAKFDKAGDVEPPKPVAAPISKNAPDWVKGLSPDAQETLRKAGVWVANKSLRERFTEMKQNLGLKIIQGTVDQFRPVLQRLGEYPYKLLRMAASSDAGLEASMYNGHVEMNDWGALQIKKGTKGLLEILKPLRGETDRFLAWVAGNRAERLAAEGREHNFTPEDIATLKSLNGSTGPNDAWTGEGSRAMTYAKVLREWNDYSKSILDIAEKAGIIDGESRKIWEHEFYVPFYREQEDAGKFVPGNISGMVNQYAFKKLKGGKEELRDLLANSLGNWSHLLSAAMKNNAAWQTLQHAEDLGIAHVVKEHEAEKGDVFVLQNGKKVYYHVDDPLVLDAISSLDQTPFRGPVMKALSQFKHALTVGTTMSPVFRLRHTFREQITALAANPTTYNFVKNWVDGFKYSSRDNPQYGNMLAGGSFMRMGQNLDADRAAHVKRLIAEGVDENHILDNPNKVKAALLHAYDWWKETGERSDSITRANLYRQTYAKMIEAGKSPEQAHFEAAYVARDAMDFGLHGTWAAVRMLTQVVPFMNARLQGIYKLGRGAHEDPKRFAAVIGGVTLATIGLSLANYGDKEIESLPDSDHDNNWIFRVGNTVYRIPKPFEVGALATVVDRATRVALDGFKPTDREAFMQRLWPIVGAQLNLNPIPQAVWPAIQLWANKDAFRGAAIETHRDEKLSVDQRIGPNTSAVAQLVGKAGVLSPEQIDFLVNAYFGWVGSHAVATADLAVRPIIGAPEKAARRLDDYFLIGDFAHSLPSNQSRFVEDYYTHLKEVQQAFGDMRNFQKTGQGEKAREYATDHRAELQLHEPYMRIQRALSMLSQRQRYVQVANMSPDQKRAELDQLAQERNRLTEAAESARAAVVNR